MRLSLTRTTILLLAAAGSGASQGSFAMPTWLDPYPGVTPRTRTFSTFIDSNYKTDADPADVIGHYQKLFAAAGLPFFPQKGPISTTIHGETAAYSLKIDVRRFAGATLVDVTCSPPIDHKKQDDAMRTLAKFDQPVYPTARPQLPSLTWPSWLVQCDGAALHGRPGVDQFKLNYLVAEYECAADRAAIQSFYADLLNSHNYPVLMQSSKLLKADGTAMVEGARYVAEQPGPRFTVHVELRPVEGAFHVSVRITAHP